MNRVSIDVKLYGNIQIKTYIFEDIAVLYRVNDGLREGGQVNTLWLRLQAFQIMAAPF